VQVHPGDIVRVEYDTVAGTLSFAVNGVSQGVCFSDLKGMELFPAVAFYSSSRSATVLSLTVEGGASAPVAATAAATGAATASAEVPADASLPAPAPVMAVIPTVSCAAGGVCVQYDMYSRYARGLGTCACGLHAVQSYV
jgi:hypothetical protein